MSDAADSFERTRLYHLTKRQYRLTKAAPQMLDALIAAINLFYHTFAQDGTVHKQIKAAIEAAGGNDGQA